MAKKQTNRTPCPRCGKKFPAGKWCECGYQGNVVQGTLWEYMHSMTIEELRTLCRIHHVNMEGWRMQRKSDIVDMMNESDVLRVALGYPKIDRHLDLF